MGLLNDLKNRLQGNPPEFVTVPPGHKVVVYRPSPTAYVVQTQSGSWLADFGLQAPDSERVIESIQNCGDNSKPTLCIWLVQNQFLDSLKDTAQFVKKMQLCVELTKSKLAHNAVFPFALPGHEPVMNRFREIGFGVHFCADGGECFVEVHRPDGIVVGMPGKAYKT